MSQSDPTDNALAAIASILDQPEIRREPVKTVAEETPEAVLPIEVPPTEARPVETRPVEARPVEAHGYSRVGPGPMAAIRFKWTVRLEDGNFYVDETFGDGSSPIVTGPMTREAAIQMVDDRESEARRRFEQLKSEMAGRGGA